MTFLRPHGLQPPGTSVREISQARKLEWVAICSSRHWQVDSLPLSHQGSLTSNLKKANSGEWKQVKRKGWLTFFTLYTCSLKTFYTHISFQIILRLNFCASDRDLTVNVKDFRMFLLNIYNNNSVRLELFLHIS